MRTVGALVLMIVGGCLWLSGCATLGVRAGGVHVVRSGETMASIAAKRRVAVQALAEWNNIQQEAELTPGRRLFIPARRMDRADKFFASQIMTPAAPSSGRRAGKVPEPPRLEAKGERTIKTYHGRFVWPVDGPVHSMFGIRNGRRHDGVDIGGGQGDPIRAAAAGDVAFAGQLSGYGNIVILRHPEQFYTAYAHNTKNLVEKGTPVKQGTVIARVGATGRASGPHLHFEVRYGQQARNPLFFLPPRNEAERAIASRAPPTQTASVRRAGATGGEKPPKAKARVARAGRGPATGGPSTNEPVRTERWQKFRATPQAKPKIHTPFRAKQMGQ